VGRSREGCDRCRSDHLHRQVFLARPGRWPDVVSRTTCCGSRSTRRCCPIYRRRGVRGRSGSTPTREPLRASAATSTRIGSMARSPSCKRSQAAAVAAAAEAAEVEVAAGTGTCTSQTMGTDMPTGSCVQSAADHKWYKCDAGAWFATKLDRRMCFDVRLVHVRDPRSQRAASDVRPSVLGQHVVPVRRYPLGIAGRCDRRDGPGGLVARSPSSSRTHARETRGRARTRLAPLAWRALGERSGEREHASTRRGRGSSLRSHGTGCTHHR